MPKLPPVSILDLIVMSEGQQPNDALEDADRLVHAADRLGYARYWVAEHHNSPSIASTTPSVALAYLGRGTERIRLGSGGVMLPNHTPFLVAEQFALLESFFPGRIDLGLGRAPGTDPATAAALRQEDGSARVDSYPQDVLEVLAWLGEVRDEIADDVFARIHVSAGLSEPPEVWLLGSSLFSAELAGRLGLRYAYANHFDMNPNPVAIGNHYRKHFEPSPELAAPHLLVTASVLAAETSERAAELDISNRVQRHRLLTGKLGPVLAPAEARDYAEREGESRLWPVAHGSQYSGTGAEVAAGLADLAERTGADELMLTVGAFDPDDRLRAVELIADAAQW